MSILDVCVRRQGSLLTIVLPSSLVYVQATFGILRIAVVPSCWMRVRFRVRLRLRLG